MSNKIFDNITILFCLSSIYFYSPSMADPKILKAIYVLMMLVIVFLLLFKDVGNAIRDSRFSFPVKLIVGSILFSIVPAYVSWHQRPFITFVALLPCLGYLFYFFLKKRNISTDFLEKIVIYLGLINFVFYIVSFLVFPTILFGNRELEDVNTDRGFARIIIGGLGYLYLAYFLALNKYIEGRGNKWLIIFIVCLVGIFMTLTRQVIAACLLIGFYFFIRNLSLLKKILFLSIVAGLLFIVVPQLSFIHILIDKTQSQTAGLENDIRYLAANYFLFNFSPDTFTSIFGNGEAAAGKSSYGNYVLMLKEHYRFFQSDIGFIGFYSKFGFVGIIGWLLLFILIFRSRFERSKQYLPAFFALLLLTGLTSSIPFNPNYISAICIAIYIADRSFKRSNSNNGVNTASNNFVRHPTLIK